VARLLRPLRDREAPGDAPVRAGAQPAAGGRSARRIRPMPRSTKRYFPLYMGTMPRSRRSGPWARSSRRLPVWLPLQHPARGLSACRMKLVAPGQQIFVEVYSGAAVPVDGGLLFAHPPYSSYYPPPCSSASGCWSSPTAPSGSGKEASPTGRTTASTPAPGTRPVPGRAQDVGHDPARATGQAVTHHGLRFSLAACRQHPDHYEPTGPGGIFDDMYNTPRKARPLLTNRRGPTGSWPVSS